MKNIDIFPLFADVISASFGGAIIGNWIGGYPIAFIAAIVTAILFIGVGINTLKKKRSQNKEEITKSFLHS